MSVTEVLPKQKRNFLKKDFSIDSWADIKPYYEHLASRPINSSEELYDWLKDRSELDSVISEYLGRLYIKTAQDTNDVEANESYNHFITNISPKTISYKYLLDKKFIESPYLNDYSQDKYFTYVRHLRQSVKIYREENISLYTEINIKSKQYSAIRGSITVNIDGQDRTIQQASKLLRSVDRDVRENAYNKIALRKSEDIDLLDKLFNELIESRHKVAVNAGFNNFRDYIFVELGRFDYTISDCMEFHDSIKEEVMPVIENLTIERKNALNLSQLKPWDMDMDISGKEPLRPYSSEPELIDKTKMCFSKLRPFFSECIEIMNQMGYLDLDSRKGKAPGGFNYPLHEVGIPFIFMNSVGSSKDLTTMVHEGGHAIHSFLTRDMDFLQFKEMPSEVAEFASMSMELMSMEHWDIFFENEADLNRAKAQQLKRVLKVFPWVAAIDRFQHWIYTNPNHTIEERKKAWLDIYSEFSSSHVNWSGQETDFETAWQNQLHIFEAPFYYIEYAMAQLGAIAMWKQFKDDRGKAIEGYIAALKLGYTKPIGEIYETAGVKFSFSRPYVKELVSFVKSELANINI